MTTFSVKPLSETIQVIVKTAPTPIFNADQLNNTQLGDLSGVSQGDTVIWNSLLGEWQPGPGGNGGTGPTGTGLICDALDSIIYRGSPTGVSESTATGCTIIGCGAGTSSITGPYNSFFGYETGSQNNELSSSVGVGQQALYNVSGSSKIAIGQLASFTGSSKDNTIAIGNSAGHSGQGSNCIAIGYQAGQTAQATGSVAIGYQAGRGSQGVSSIAIGDEAGYTGQSSLSVAIGCRAGHYLQGVDFDKRPHSTIAIGYEAGRSHQGNDSIAIGHGAGQSGQTNQAVAIGNSAGRVSQGQFSVALGYSAGGVSQSDSSIGIGRYAGVDRQGTEAVAIGHKAGENLQGLLATAVGSGAGQTRQGVYSIAIGSNSGNISQSNFAVAVGNDAGQFDQGGRSIAIGDKAGQNRQMTGSIAIGYVAAQDNQGENSVAIGSHAGSFTQGDSSIAIGNKAGQTSQMTGSIAIGYQAAQDNQGITSIAIGSDAGRSTQGQNCIGIGNTAGEIAQGTQSVAIGHEAGRSTQGFNSVAIGSNSGNISQSNFAVAVGSNAGFTSQGTSAVAIGNLAGQTNQDDNTIVINASGVSTTSETTSACYIRPVRNMTGPTVLQYNSSTFEITHDDTFGGPVGFASNTSDNRDLISSPTGGLALYNTTEQNLDVYSTGLEKWTGIRPMNYGVGLTGATGFQDSRLVSTDSFFGRSTAITSNGQYRVVGAPGALLEGRIYCSYFDPSLNSYVELPQLEGGFGASGDEFGTSVGISDNARFIIGGAPSNTGRITIFRRTENSDDFNFTSIATRPGESPGDLYGQSVSISASGQYLMVGAPFFSSVGRIYWYELDNSGTISDRTILDVTNFGGDVNPTINGNFGTSVATQNEWAVCGGPGLGNTTNRGVTFAFQRTGTAWAYQTNLTNISGAAEGDDEGVSVDISGNELYILSGAIESSSGGIGHVRVFSRSGTTWSSATTLTPSDGVDGDEFGSTVKLDYDGKFAAVSSPLASNGGKVYLYKRSEFDNTVWSEINIFEPSGIGAGDKFGWGLAISGDGYTVLAGAQNEDTGASNRGMAYQIDNNVNNIDMQEGILKSGKVSTDVLAPYDEDNGRITITGKVAYQNIPLSSNLTDAFQIYWRNIGNDSTVVETNDIFANSSIREHKTNITDVPESLYAKLDNIQTRSYCPINCQGSHNYGFIADEIQDLLGDNFVIHGPEGKLQSVNYSFINNLSIGYAKRNKEKLEFDLQTLQTEHNTLQTEHNTLQTDHNTLQTEHNTLQTLVNTLQTQLTALQNQVDNL